MQDQRRLFFIYLSALAILCASVVTSLVMTEVEAQKIEADAQKINVSGRQRMLSQRIIYLSQELVLQQGGNAIFVREQLAYAVEELEASITLFETAHAALSHGNGVSAIEKMQYFEALDGQPPLDQMVKDYLVLARSILADPGDIASLDGLREIERDGLLERLDQLVGLIEAQSVEKVETLRMIGRVALIIALVIVVVEILFVFVPGHRLIDRTIRDIHRKKEELQDAYDKSEQLRTEQAEFTYAVSHDLKAPANTIKLVLNELRSEYRADVSEDALALLSEASKTVDRMGVQIEDILDYAWATGDAEEAQDVDIRACVDEAVAGLKGAIAASGARVEVAASATVCGFRQQIAMLIHNLIENGIKYQPKGAAPVVTVTAEPLSDGQGIRLCVADNGIGIAPEDHEKVFGLFQRLHLRSDYPGSGLGLATCRRVVDNHQGTIRISSELGRGCEFEVTLFPPRECNTVTQDRIAA